MCGLGKCAKDSNSIQLTCPPNTIQILPQILSQSPNTIPKYVLITASAEQILSSRSRKTKNRAAGMFRFRLKFVRGRRSANSILSG